MSGTTHDSAITTTPPTMAERISTEQHAAVHALASECVAATLQQRPIRWDEFPLGPLAEEPVFGAYVSLKRNHRLRSCCGFVNQSLPVAQAILQAAQHSACDDVRLPPISRTELPWLELETWLLDQTREVQTRGTDREREIVVGRHGLLIIQGNERGLLLPGVAIDHNFDARTFLEQVCRKAGLRPDAWQLPESRLFVFEGISHRAPLNSRAYQAGAVASPSVLPAEELHELHRWYLENIAHTLRGSTPNYYLPTVPDAMVHFVAGMHRSVPASDLAPICQLSIRPPFPLQATLYQLSQSMAQLIAHQGEDGRELSLELDLVVGHDPAMQGTTEEPDLDGFDPARRALIALRGREWSVHYVPEATPDQILERLLAERNAAGCRGVAELLSLAVHATRNPVSIVQSVRPFRGPKIRSAAVAGRFYPGKARRLQSEIDDLFRGLPTGEPARAPAVMLPHAGWRFSGRLAAEVLAGTRLPNRLIVLGPKHTASGVDFAVAPHETWQLPGISLQNDLLLAERLVDAIPEWQLDDAAHAEEHAIEVELPLIQHLAPECRVVGIALAPASWEQCRSFAVGLAQILAAEPEPPLLVISSDMNHFANDKENRRLDALALKAIASCDPEHAYHTIRDHRISMCGLVPAVVVMQALRSLGRLSSVDQVNYATSADSTGDTARVVGYAGLRFH
jgi:AmmeMemoRadiSam system protein B/AmmeMemoRadiSam system protein A